MNMKSYLGTKAYRTLKLISVLDFCEANDFLMRQIITEVILTFEILMAVS
jgi:hypothetical protein